MQLHVVIEAFMPTLELEIIPIPPSASSQNKSAGNRKHTIDMASSGFITADAACRPAGSIFRVPRPRLHANL